MKNESNLANVINYNNVALEADFLCDCGSDTFFILHSGKKHKSLLGNVSIGKKEKQLVIQCSCSKCFKQYTLFDSTKDGKNPRGIPNAELGQLEINGEMSFQIKLKYNYLEENFKTDLFETFFMEVKIPNDNEYSRICEE